MKIKVAPIFQLFIFMSFSFHFTATDTLFYRGKKTLSLFYSFVQLETINYMMEVN